MPGGRALTASERDWLAVRSRLTGHRHELAVRAAADYPAGLRVAGTPLLAAPAWRPAAPVPLGDIALELGDAAAVPPLPPGPLPAGYPSYSAAMRELAAPAVFENRSTYRLTGADLAGPAPRLRFAMGRYFDGIDTGEAAAHEYAARGPGQAPDGLRAAVGDPCDLSRRPANLAISTLTLRLAAGRASFLLHWRDPAKVGHAGGLYQVIPVGVFQPAGQDADGPVGQDADGPAGQDAGGDFSLWRCMLREFAEELAGQPEQPVVYDSWPFARRLSQGLAGAWCLGLGVDPLTFATDLLTVVVVEGPVFDELFGQGVRDNAEGSVLAAREFAGPVIEQLAEREPVQAAGAALLRLAWRHRDTLIGRIS